MKEETALVQRGEHNIEVLEKMAQYIARSGLFGIKTAEQAVALMIVAQAEGRHPGSVAADYHIIQGRPSLKADTMLARFQQNGGCVKWDTYTDSKVVGTFTHPQGGSVTVDWDMDRARRAGLGSKDNWKTYPRAMLRARVISEGIRTVLPGVLGGMYTPEEVQDFAPVSPAPTPPEEAETTPEMSPVLSLRLACAEHGITDEVLDRFIAATAEQSKKDPEKIVSMALKNLTRFLGSIQKWVDALPPAKKPQTEAAPQDDTVPCPNGDTMRRSYCDNECADRQGCPSFED